MKFTQISIFNVKGGLQMDSSSKWNSKYTKRLLEKREQPTPNERFKKLSRFLKGGQALDIACGLGANSIYLSKLGFEVHALDISDVAIDDIKSQAKQQQLLIHTHVCDLTKLSILPLQKNSFDLVVITYYLDRSIYPLVKELIKDNGFFFMETFYLTENNEANHVSDQYKLYPNELLTEFKDWHVLFFEEDEHEGRQTILASKREPRKKFF